MADAQVWRCKNRELIVAMRVLRDRFGEPAVDAVAEVHRNNVRQAFRKKAAETGRNDLAALAESARGSSETHTSQVLRQDDRVLEIRITRCAHAEQYAEWNARDVGLKFMCAGDLAMIEGLNPRITLERPKLLMNGDDCCHFIYRLED